jgi:tRNA threonylcarbamoyladenosine modification (KEOPS) complex  Pcc1 subunit
MKAQAIVYINYSSKKQLHVVLNALKPEIKTSSTKRSKVDIFPKNKNLVLDFKAKDTSALRAAINSYLRLINVAMTLQNLTK